MTLLTREAILRVSDRKTERVKVPEWGGEVIVSVMTGEMRDAWEQSLVGKPGEGINLKNARARLLAYCMVDERGALLFKPEDIEQLGKKSGTALERCSRVAQRLNAIRDQDVEDMVKNSSAVPSGTSTSS